LNRGVVKVKQGQYETALTDYNKVIELNANYTDAYTNRTLLYAILSKKTEAFADIDKALSLNQNNAAATAKSLREKEVD